MNRVVSEAGPESAVAGAPRLTLDEDIRLERSFIAGMQLGFRFGLDEDRAGLAANIMRRIDEIVQAKRDAGLSGGEPEGSSTLDSPAPLIPNQRNT